MGQWVVLQPAGAFCLEKCCLSYSLTQAISEGVFFFFIPSRSGRPPIHYMCPVNTHTYVVCTDYMCSDCIRAGKFQCGNSFHTMQKSAPPSEFIVWPLIPGHTVSMCQSRTRSSCLVKMNRDTLFLALAFTRSPRPGLSTILGCHLFILVIPRGHHSAWCAGPRVRET